MADFIVDSANFYTLARMNGSSGLELLQALIDAGHKIVITDAVEAEITFAETADYKDAQIASDWIRAHQSDIEVVPTDTFRDLFPNGSDGSPLPRDLGEQSILWLANSSHYANNPAIIVSDDSKFFGPDIFNPTKHIQDGVVRHTTDSLLKYALDIDLIDQTDYVILRDELLVTDRIEVKYSYTNSDLSVSTSVDPIDGSLVYKNIAGDEVHVSFVATDPFVKLQKVFGIYAGALSEAHDGMNGSLVGDESIVSLLARFMADKSGGVDPAVFAEAAQHLFNQLKEGFSHPNFEASFKAGLVAQFGSSIGDAAELLNAAYEPFIHGFQTGDWSKLGETVFEFGLSSAIGSFVVGAAAVGVGITLGTTAAEIFALGVVAVGISDGINAALSLASKIFDDLTEAIQPQEQSSQQLLDDLLIRRLLGHLYDQDNPNFQLKDVLRQLVTLSSAEGPEFRLTGPTGSYDAEHATLIIGTANGDRITSTDDNDVIFSGAGDDVVTARGGKDIVLGGAGSDIFIDSVTEETEDGRSNEADIYVGSEAFGDVSQNFHNWLSGGGETDIVRYTVDSFVADDPETPQDEGRLQQEGVRVTDLSLSNIHTIQTVAITVEDRAKGNAATDQLIGIEKVELSGRPDELIVKDHSLDVAILIDMGKSGRIESELPVGETLTFDAFTIKVDVVDYSSLSHGINYLNGVTSDHDDVSTLDNVFQWQGYDQELLTIVDYAAKGALGYNNALHVQGADQVKLSDHDDVLISADFGSIITTGEGQDKIWFTNGIGVTDLSNDDRIALGGVLTLYGGLKNEASEDPYAWGPYGTAYALNAEGELVIRNAFWHVANPDGTPSDEVATMYVLNWKDRTTQGPGGEGEVGPGGIFLAEYHMSFVRFRDITQDMKGQYSVLGEGAFDILGLMIKTMTGHYPWGGQDPLVLDLDGDGIELTALDRSKSKLDLDNDLYSESSGFVGKDDGVLVRDLNGDGKITGSNEMFGNATTSGLAALALLDGNHDGKVDAGDSGLADFNGDGTLSTADTFSSLLIWQDANENHRTDVGELKSVTERGIASINVTANPVTAPQAVNGNTITSTAGYTMADGTVRTIADVVLRLDNQNTTYVGAPITVSQSVLDLADLRGRGTLVSLHEAMSVVPSAEATVRTAVQSLTSPVLSDLREAIRPILTAWAEGSPVKIGGNIVTGTAGLAAYDDLAIVRKDGDVVDYAWGVSSSGDNTSDIPGIRMASGVIVSSSGGVSGRGELSDLLAQWTSGGSSVAVTTGTELHNGVSISYLDYRNGDDYLRIYNYGKAVWSSSLASSANHSLDAGIAVETVAGSDFSFYERLIGESLQAFFDVPDSASAGYLAVAAFLDKMDDALNLFAVRLAVQSGPLAHYFDSINYNAGADGFTSKSGTQIAAVFTALLADAEQSSNAVSWLTDWKPFFDVFLSDYSRGSVSQKNTYAFLAQNMLNAVEQHASGISVVDFAHAFGMAQDLFFTGTGEVNGSGQDDILIVDGGETVVRGGKGSDNYVIGKSFGSTEIFDDDGIGGSVDTVRFSAHNADDIIASRDGIDLLLTDKVTGAVLRISNEFEGRWPGLMISDASHDFGINQIVFKDGTVWTKVDIAEAVSKIDDASTHVTGTEDIDVLQGGKGDDLLEGGGDTDIYRYGRGDGQDTIHDFEGNAFRNDQDMLQFLDGIRSGDLIFQRDGASNDLVIRFKDNPLDKITIQGQFAATYTGPYGTWYMNRIDLFTFDNGSSLTSDQVASIVLQAHSTDGNDQLYGMEREDILRAGKGDDFISGGNQNDLYLYALGDGHDIIQDRMTNILSGTDDFLRFGAGIDREDISFGRVDGDRHSIVIYINGGEGSVTLQNEFAYAASGVFGDIFFDRIERIDFTSGDQSIAWYQIATTVIAGQKTDGADVIEGFDIDDVLDGGAGNDTLYGYNGNDTYVWGRGYGNDQIQERGAGALNGGDYDKIIFHDYVTADDIVLSRTPGASDIIITLKDTGETLTLIEQVSYNAINYRPDQVDEIHFSDGVIWSASDIRAHYLLDAKTDGDDHIYGFWTNNTLDGGAGNDILEGGDGSDTYVFGYGYGHDEIRENYGIVTYDDDDAVRFAAGVDLDDVTFQRSGEYDLLISLAGSSDTLLVTSEFYVGVWDMNDVERFLFADGTQITREQISQRMIEAQSTSGDDTINGFELNDTINGSGGNDIINAGKGADSITGGRGNDVIDGGGWSDSYYYSRGDGNDTIVDGDWSGRSDRLFFKDVNSSEVSLVRNGNSLLIVIAESAPGVGDGGSVLLKETIDGFYERGIETISFADGISWSRDVFVPMVINQQGTPGNDTITGSNIADTLAGGKGDDTINGGGGYDTYVYARGDGNDTMFDGDWSGNGDRLLFVDINPGNISLLRQGNSLKILIAETAPGAGDGGSILFQDTVDGFYEKGFETIQFANGTIWTNDQVRQMLVDQATTGGNDTITGTGRGDILRGGAGNDTLNGGGGGDAYVYARGDGNDTMFDGDWSGSGDQIRFVDINPNEVTLVRQGNDLKILIRESVAGAGDGGSILFQDTVNGFYEKGFETIRFANGTIWTNDQVRQMLMDQAATAGNDTIDGSDRADILQGDAGNDTLTGRGGGDLYVWAHGDGSDTIVEGDWAGTGDRLQLSDVNPQDVTYLRNGNDIVIIIPESAPGAGDGGSISLPYFLDGYYERGVESVLFADGTIYTRTEILPLLPIIQATAGNDSIDGSNGADTFEGGRGNDVLNGLGGNDTYRYSRGDGADTVIEGSAGGADDRLVFANINSTEVTLSRNGTDLTITIPKSTPTANDAGSVLLRAALDGDQGGVETVVFADGVEWTKNDIRVKLLGAVSTSGNDAITGFSSGDDITGGLGNDTINGAGGNDVYHYARGDGNDIITEATANGVADTLAFNGIFASDVSWGRIGTDLVLTIAPSVAGGTDGSTITLKGALDANAEQGIERFVFADGTVWTFIDFASKIVNVAGTTGAETLSGTSGSDVIRADAGSDVINGGGGSDVYLYQRGDGNDTINDDANGGSNDRLVLADINPAAVTLVRNGIDVSLVIAPTVPGGADGGTILIKNELDEYYARGLEQIVFADGTVWSRADLRTMILQQAGTAGNDVIDGFNIADTIRGGKGDDSLNGQGSNDTYLYARGDGNDAITEWDNAGDDDRLVFTNINANDVTLVRTGIDLKLMVAESTAGAGDAGSIVLKNMLDDYYARGVDKVVFADGTAWTRADFRTKVLQQAATDGNDTIDGFNVADTIRGNKGNDSLNGQGNNDTYLYARGDGNDTVTEWDNAGDDDRLVFTNVNASDVTLVRAGIDLKLVIAESAAGVGDAGSIVLKNMLDDYYARGVDKVVFADGTTWMRADFRTKVLEQAVTAGNDTIDGFNVADTIRGGKGDDSLNGQANNDTYVYTRGDGNDVITEWDNAGDDDRLVLSDINASDVTLVRAGIDLKLVIAESATGVGDGGSIVLKNMLDDYYARGVDKVVFADGTIWTRATIRTKLLTQAATDGNDTIDGFNVADTIHGGKGDDSLNGQANNDTYVYTRGDGNDVITEYENAGGSDRLVFADLNAADVTLVRNGNDVTVLVAESAAGAGNAGSVTLKASLQDYYGRGVDTIVFADGTNWSRTDMIAHVAYVGGTAGNDTISGTAGADEIRAGTGNDTLVGGAGNDTYVYSAADGNDIIDEQTSGTDVDILRLRDLLKSDVRFERSASAPNDVMIRVLATGEAITLKNQFNLAGGIESIVFADGETLGGAAGTLDAVLKNLVAIYGTTGNDNLPGTADSDTYVYLGGNDIIDEQTSGTSSDILRLDGLLRSEIRFERNGSAANDAILRVLSTGETITLKNQFNAAGGVESIVFKDGEVLGGAAGVLDTALKGLVSIVGTTGNDTLVGTSDADTFIGGTGDDRFNSGAGSDIYVYAKGDGNDYIDDESGSTVDVDVLRLTDLNATDVILTRAGVHSILTVIETGHTITLDEQFYSSTANWGLDRIQFADGTIWDRAQIQAASWIRGTAGNDTLSGTTGNDTFIGGTGDDRFNSGAGSDVYVYAKGEGNDYIDDESGSTTDVDVLRLTDLNTADVMLSRVGVHSVLTVIETGQTITFDEQFYSATANWGLDRIQFADGTVWDRTQIQAASWIRGAAGNDTLTGTSSNETLTGGAGNDVLNGGAGNDTIYGDAGNDNLTGGAGDDLLVFKAGFGNDTVTDFTIGAGSVDVLDIGTDLFSDFASVLAAASQVGADTVITHDANTSITLKNVALTSLHQDDFRFTAAA
ncbi:Ca2+-binding RTX toxin-like protein [Rhizobium sp. BK226]|uniref:calcium-binding protein n=1 Tax=Rhizobium sp. BK226 TaxID=2587075 RepID=UPI00161FB2CF|nr:calcium-binding protein [Rhizobium sp. BK226]MBB4112774.1 Ca2+-binding RTX toxin-like protein [Rhizobium sp. BK226]